jgi:negative regulator of flagellin synthesis FlgM
VKITQNGTDPLRPARAGQAETRVRQANEQGAAASTGSASASIQLSAASRETQGSEAPFNAAHVEEIKQAIREGRFKVNAEAVADKFLQIERELSTSK